jgi:hypothetical protein
MSPKTSSRRLRPRTASIASSTIPAGSWLRAHARRIEGEHLGPLLQLRLDRPFQFGELGDE